MILFHTLTADNSVLAIHQTLAAARAFAATWQDSTILNRTAAFIVSAERGSDCIRPRTYKFNDAAAIERFAL